MKFNFVQEEEMGFATWRLYVELDSLDVAKSNSRGGLKWNYFLTFPINQIANFRIRQILNESNF